MKRQIAAALCLVLGAIACSFPAFGNSPSPPARGNTVQPGTAPPVSQPTALNQTQQPAPAEPPTHTIGIRQVNGVGQFYDRTTQDAFVPRGANYVRLGPQRTPDGHTQTYHTTFDPGAYDSARAGAALGDMHALGYNVVRVFVSQNTIGTPNDGLSKAYMQNVADFLTRARQNGVYVIITQDWLPGGAYGRAINSDCCNLFNFNNAQNMTPGAVRAYQLYYTDFIRDLYDLGAPTDAILSYELRNEFYYDTDYPPFSLASGTVTTANGSTYDMSSAADKQRMAEENLPYFIDHVRTTILKLDPSALVSIGFFQPQSPNPTRLGDKRLVVTSPAIWNSDADFIDLHAYPDADLNLRQYVENFGIKDMQAKPIIMGEFGAQKSSYGSAQAAAQHFVGWQVDSCKYGFDGWLFWTWDTNEDPVFFNAQQNGGVIASALAPAARADPCH